MRVSRWQKATTELYTADATNGARVELARTRGAWRLLVDGRERVELTRSQGLTFDDAEAALVAIPDRRLFGLDLEDGAGIHDGYQAGPRYSTVCAGELGPGPRVLVGSYGATPTCPACLELA